MSTASSSASEWSVEGALQTLGDARPVEHSASPLPLHQLLGRLKTTQRAGWKRFAVDRQVLSLSDHLHCLIISRVESIADHSYRMAMMCFYPPPSIAQALDRSKCMEMCLVHDIAETLVGDITPADGVPKREKLRRERLTHEYMQDKLLDFARADPDSHSSILALWKDFEDGTSLECKFVRDLDKYEMLVQMLDYELRHKGNVNLQEFTYVVTKMELDTMKSWAMEIIEQRDRFWEGLGKPNSKTSLGDTQDQDQYYGP